MLDKKLVIEVMQKAARCWAGYEPVPGAKAYSEGSCRPKGSKKTKKEVIQGKNHSEKKAADFNVDHARSIFAASPVQGFDHANATPTQLYTRMKNMTSPYSTNRTSNAAKQFASYYNNQMPAIPQPAGTVAQAAPPARPPVAKRPSPCGPGGCPVPRPAKPPVARTPQGTPRLVPGVPPVPAKPLAPGQRPSMVQMPPRQ
jgi:hypothetical protein